MSRIIIVALAVIFLSGCAELLEPMPTPMKTGFPVGGSRADGTVTLVYEYDRYETYQVNWGDMQKQAQDRCSRWGYLTAEPFGGGIRECIHQEQKKKYDYCYPGEIMCLEAPIEYECIRWRVSIEYQCQTLEQPISRPAISTSSFG